MATNSELEKKMKISNNEDRISQLPDSVIHHILSFLDTKYVVQTSVLSKRWLPLWTSIPTLNFNDSILCSPKPNPRFTSAFIRLVDMILLRRDSSNIQRLRLLCRHCECATLRYHIYTWILVAVSRKVQDLRIEMPDNCKFQFPSCILTCTSLTKLVIRIVSRRSSELIINSVDLPNLEYLELCGLSMAENLTNNFFSSCPALESLVLEDFCIKDSDKNFNIYCPNLKHLTLNNIDFPTETEIEIVKVYAPELRSFTCKDMLTQEYYLDSFNCLETADIGMVLVGEYDQPEQYSDLSLQEKELYTQFMMHFLRMLHNVKNLELSFGFLEAMMGDPKMVHSTPIQFPNLRCLKLDSLLSRASFRAITYLLESCPNIESLLLDLHLVDDDFPRFPNVDEVTFSSETNVDYWEAGSSLSCMLYHLKFVQIRYLWGCVNELKFLENLLKHSVVLEKLVLRYRDSMEISTEKRMELFSKMVQSFARASKAGNTLILFRAI